MIGKQIEVNIGGGLDIQLPRMATVRQKFQTSKLRDVTEAIRLEFQRQDIRNKIKPGMSIAVGCGSRGVANIAESLIEINQQLKSLGAKPFVFPAMGSHGGATAEGQREVLPALKITSLWLEQAINNRRLTM